MTSQRDRVGGQGCQKWYGRDKALGAEDDDSRPARGSDKPITINERERGNGCHVAREVRNEMGHARARGVRLCWRPYPFPGPAAFAD